MMVLPSVSVPSAMAGVTSSRANALDGHVRLLDPLEVGGDLGEAGGQVEPRRTGR